MLFEDTGEQLSVLVEGVVDVHLSHSSEPSESISVHDYVSGKTEMGYWYSFQHK